MESKQIDSKITRRKFLIIGAEIAIGAPATLKALEQGFYESIRLGITNSTVNDLSVSTALKVVESTPNSENPNFRSMVEILQEGLLNYSNNNPNHPAYYQKSADYRDTQYYSDVIKQFTLKHFWPQSPKKIIKEITKSFPPEALEAFNQSSSLTTGFDHLFIPGSGFNARFRQKHPEFVYKEGQYQEFSSERYQLMDQEGGGELREIKSLVEQRSREVGVPISAFYVFELFLERNEGNIAHSITDTALFLKFMARSNPNTGDFDPNNQNVSWYKQNIKDEYMGPSYISPPEGEVDVSLLGKPYHSWDIVALLQYFPTELIRVGVIQRQLANFNKQGLGKIRADVQTLDDLRDIDQHLHLFS